ncbi:hypothetical protein [Haliangium ochraceum]|uniref:hypothetical protein n=1 Tax=Haliangium ochraceum TaxID=80816 RepID=UPI0012699227|nr:hypothetical protein [Haliangium ochraceum]
MIAEVIVRLGGVVVVEVDAQRLAKLDVQVQAPILARLDVAVAGPLVRKPLLDAVVGPVLDVQIVAVLSGLTGLGTMNLVQANSGFRVHECLFRFG